MNLILENPRLYFRQFRKMENMMEFRAFVESLDVGDADSHEKIVALIEGIDIIVEGTLSPEVIDRYIPSKGRKYTTPINGKAGYYQGNEDAGKLVNEGKIDEAKPLLLGMCVPKIAKIINGLSYLKALSDDEVEDIFIDVLTEVIRKIPDWDTNYPFVPWATKYVINKFVPDALDKMGKGQDDLHQWKPGVKYRNGSAILYKNKKYIRVGGLQEEDITQIPPGDPRVAKYWYNATDTMDINKQGNSKPEFKMPDDEENEIEKIASEGSDSNYDEVSSDKKEMIDSTFDTFNEEEIDEKKDDIDELESIISSGKLSELKQKEAEKVLNSAQEKLQSLIREREVIKRLYDQSNPFKNDTDAATQLGISRPTLDLLRKKFAAHVAEMHDINPKFVEQFT